MNFRSFGYFISFHEVEGREKNKKIEVSIIKEEGTVEEEGKRRHIED